MAEGGIEHMRGRKRRKKELADKEQAYFRTEAWQRGEREAEADLEEGRVEVFESPDALIRDLEKL